MVCNTFRRSPFRARGALCVALLLAACIPSRSADPSRIVEKIELPPGFRISVFGQMPAPREIAVDPGSGLVFVGSRRGHIYSMLDSDGDGKADQVHERASGLNVPNGVAIQDSTLYVGLQDRIASWQIPADVDSTATIGPLTTLSTRMENKSHHGWRYIGFGPDRKLYVTLGAPCNICALDGLTGKIVRMDPDGSNWEIVADGVRNSVGFDWQPSTGKFWFTDNGADGMGDDIPPDELNRVSRLGGDFGFPYFGGKQVRLTGFENRQPPVQVTPAAVEFQAHSASLGMKFYDGAMFPAEYRGDAFVAQHGSWNRSEKVGYRIVRVRFDEQGEPLGTEVFASGWLENEAVFGRPVDIKQLSDGSLLVSDDKANVIYRITYGE